MEEKKLLICSCHSLEHQILFWYLDGYLYSEVHLTTWHGFFRRFWYGMKYAFGYKSRFGAWDEFLFDGVQMEELKQFLINLDDPAKNQKP